MVVGKIEYFHSLLLVKKMLMPNKWICSAIWCGLTGVFVALGYLLLVASQPALVEVSNAPPDWLIGLFCSMLLLSVLLNLIAFFGLEVSVKPIRRWWGLRWLQKHRKQQLDHFFQQYATELHPLDPAADVYLWTHGQQASVIKLMTPNAVKCSTSERLVAAQLPPQLPQMRQLLQLKLQYQCQHAYWLSAEPLDFITRIYARESGIHCLLFRELSQLVEQKLPRQ
jgi:hypothetical protein